MCAALLCGCSGGGNPVLPGEELPPELTSGTGDAQTGHAGAGTGNHIPLGVYRLSYDAESGTIEVIPDRELLGHLNVTGFLQPPKCSDCLILKLVGVDPVERILHLRVVLKNPFPDVSGYDPRFILDAAVDGYALTNPNTDKADGYTELWDIQGESRNPFIAFAKDQTQREAGPLTTHEHFIDLHYPGSLNVDDLLITIDACFPDNCPEPFEIADVQLGTNKIPENGSTDISCLVHSWSGDIDKVTARIEAEGNPDPVYSVDLENTTGDLYEGTIDLAGSSVPPGHYELWLKAVSVAEPTISMWHVRELHVVTVPGGWNGWAYTWGGIDLDRSYGVAVDDSGNVYVTGRFNNTVEFDPDGGDPHTSNGGSDVFLSKFDSSGNFEWARTWGGSEWDCGYEVAADGAGNVFVTGEFRGTVDFDPDGDIDEHTSNGWPDVFLSKFDSSGNFEWARTWGGSWVDLGFGVAVDGSGNVYVTGFFWYTVDFDPGGGWDYHTSNGQEDVFLSKFDSSGNFQWALTWGGTIHGDYDRGQGVAVDGSGNVYVTGKYMGTVDFDPGDGWDYHYSNGQEENAFLSKFDSSGNFAWARTWGGLYSDQGYGVAVDGSGNAYVTGYFQDTVDFNPGGGDPHTSNGFPDVFLTKFDSSGNFQWARTWGGSWHDYGRGVAADGSGNVYVTGYFMDTVDFDPGGGDPHTSNGQLDIFLSKFDSSGNFEWAQTWGGLSADVGYGVSADGSGNVYVTGHFEETVDFDPSEEGTEYHTSYGWYDDVFLSRLPADGAPSPFCPPDSNDTCPGDQLDPQDSVTGACLDVYDNQDWYFFYCPFGIEFGSVDLHVTGGNADLYVYRAACPDDPLTDWWRRSISSGSGENEHVSLPESDEALYYILVEHFGNTGKVDYDLVLNVVEQEPSCPDDENDMCVDAELIPAITVFDGCVGQDDSEDWYKLDCDRAISGGTILFHCKGPGIANMFVYTGPCDNQTKIYLPHPAGQEYQIFDLPHMPAECYIRIVHEGSPSPQVEYTLEVVAEVVPHAKWTFLVYLAEEENIQECARDDVNEMEEAGSSAGDLNVVLLWGETGNPTLDRACYVERDPSGYNNQIVSPPVNDCGAIDPNGDLQMDDAEQLENFLRWAMLYYPADKYALVLWGHSDGVPFLPPEGGGPINVPPGDGGIENSWGVLLDIWEMEQACSNVLDEHPEVEKLDVIAFHSCQLEWLETAYCLRGVTRALVGSELYALMGPHDYGFSYGELLDDLSSNASSWDHENLSEEMVSNYLDHVDWGYSMAAVRCDTNLDLVISFLDIFATELKDCLSDYRQQIEEDRTACGDWARDCTEPFAKDLGYFAEIVSQDSLLPQTLRDFATELRSAIDGAVIAHGHNGYIPFSPCPYSETGMLIWFPDNYDDSSNLLRRQAYEELGFTETLWDEFLTAFDPN